MQNYLLLITVVWKTAYSRLHSTHKEHRIKIFVRYILSRLIFSHSLVAVLKYEVVRSPVFQGIKSNIVIVILITIHVQLNSKSLNSVLNWLLYSMYIQYYVNSAMAKRGVRNFIFLNQNTDWLFRKMYKLTVWKMIKRTCV